MAVITSLACGVCVHGLPNALQTYSACVAVLLCDFFWGGGGLKYGQLCILPVSEAISSCDFSLCPKLANRKVTQRAPLQRTHVPGPKSAFCCPPFPFHRCLSLLVVIKGNCNETNPNAILVFGSLRSGATARHRMPVGDSLRACNMQLYTVVL